LHGDAIFAALASLGSLLVQTRHLWSPRSFEYRTLPWEEDHPELAGFLRGLDDQQLKALAEPFSAAGLADGTRCAPWADAAPARSSLPPNLTGQLHQLCPALAQLDAWGKPGMLEEWDLTERATKESNPQRSDPKEPVPKELYPGESDPIELNPIRLDADRPSPAIRHGQPLGSQNTDRRVPPKRSAPISAPSQADPTSIKPPRLRGVTLRKQLQIDAFATVFDTLIQPQSPPHPSVPNGGRMRSTIAASPEESPDASHDASGNTSTLSSRASEAGTTASNARPILDWCAGKGHLSRALAHRGHGPFLCVEHDPAIVLAGTARAVAEHLPIGFAQQDVHEAAIEPVVRHASSAVALHACGDLHRRLLTLATQTQTGTLLLAPCCHDRTAEQDHRPMSESGSRCGLNLSRMELRMVSQQLVTASKARGQLRTRETAYRLGLDEILRQTLNRSTYTTIRPTPRRWLQRSFGEYCGLVAKREGWQLPQDLSEFERAGQVRALEVTRLGVVRRMSQRALEIWLVLDLAAYLLEHGYDVDVTEFCPQHVSPRNLLIAARHKHSTC
jgi:hypothetical protein